MSETHESGCFPCGWWKKREETKANAVDHSKRSGQLQESNVEEVKTAGTTKYSTPFSDVTVTEVRPSGQSEVKLANDRDVAVNIGYPAEATKEAPKVQISRIEQAETAMTTEQSIDVKDTTAMEAHPSSASDGTRPGKDTDAPVNIEHVLGVTKKGLVILKGIADIAKFPLVKEVIELGISILDTYQSTRDVESGIQQLKDDICRLLVSIAEGTKEAEMSDGLEKDLVVLKECLTRILGRLRGMTSQNGLEAWVFSESNINTIRDCEKDFQRSVACFQTLRSLETGQNLVLIQRQLATFRDVSLDATLNLTENVEDIKREVKDMKSVMLKSVQSSKRVGAVARIPQLTSQLYGREEVVQRIAEHLSTSDPKLSRVCILAAGGMGKTSTALAVMHHSLTEATFGEHRYWVPCVQANSIENFIDILFKHVKAEKRTGDPLEDIMATLQETDKRRIILLDNFETPWRGIANGENLLKPILADLNSIPHVSILMTMRSEWAPLEAWHCEHLDPINPGDSQSLYTSIHPDARNYPEQLKDLLDALGHMPFAITLMASRGKRSGADPGKLLKEWRQKGTDMLSRRAEGINWCIELSVESSYVQESEDALRILQILSMLPAGVDQQHLSIWAGEWSSQAIETLRDTALIITRPVSTREESTVDRYFVLPVVQSYMAQKGRIPPEVREAVLNVCYRFLTENNFTVEGPNDPRFKKHLAAIASQEANLQAMITDAMKDKYPLTSTLLSPSNHLDALLAYVNYQRWARPRPEIAQQVVSLAQTVGALRQEALALFCLGKILKQMVRAMDAHQAFENAHAAFERIGDDHMAFRSRLEQFEVDIHWDASSIEPWDAINDIRTRWENACSVNLTFCTELSYSEGYLHWSVGNFKKAISIATQAAEAFDRLGMPCERADGHYISARSYAGLQDFGAALHHIDLVISLQNHLFGDDFKIPDVVLSLLMRVRYLKGMGRWDDEMETTLAAALESSRELGLSRAIIQLLFELGEVSIQKGDLPGARDAYEEILRKGERLEDWHSKQKRADAEQNLKHLDYLCAKAQGYGEANYVPFIPPVRC